MYVPIARNFSVFYALLLAVFSVSAMEWVARIFVTRQLLLDRKIQCAFLVPCLLQRGLPLRVRTFRFDQVRIKREWEANAMSLCLTIANRFEVFVETEVVTAAHATDPLAARAYLLGELTEVGGDWEPIEDPAGDDRP